MESKPKSNKLGLGGLIAMIIGSTIGGGIFTTVGDMSANGAYTGAILIGWGIAGIGMYTLMMAFFGLNKYKPELKNGIYSYAQAGFGEFIGFNSAWGYWMSALICNVSFITLLFGALGYFFPVFGEGNNLISIICGSVIVWLLTALVCKGVKSAAFLTTIGTICKIIPILIFIVMIPLIGAFDTDVFMDNFWGNGDIPLGNQIMATTSSTVWAFIGVEGAVVLSGRAKKTSDVGKASLIGFTSLLALYVLVAVMSMGIMTTEEMAELKNPQLAQIFEAAVGPWGATMINIAVILSLTVALLGWTILAAECAFEAAKQGVFTKTFAKVNKNDAPANATIITNALVQFFLLVILFNESSYFAFYTIGSSMIMLPYLLSALYYEKVTRHRDGMQGVSNGEHLKGRIFAIIGSIYGIWMIVSSGLVQFLITTILYGVGILVYVKGRREKGLPAFRPFERNIAIVIVLLGILSIILMATGVINPF
ncbi:MAG: basic amino acid/polyamine antiporter [Bacillota bacterium]|nr:basic amino acid/polyamine antiporter [Bacillota bacterium]